MATKTRVTKKQVIAHRTKSARDMSPSWDGSEDWAGDKFTAHFRKAMEFYRLEGDAKALKVKVVEYMERAGWAKSDIKLIRTIKDKYFSGTALGVAACLVKGMPEVHQGFNNGKDTGTWLNQEITKIIEQGSKDIEEEEAKDTKPTAPVISIQERVKDSAYAMTTELEDAYESFQTDPENFDPKAFKVLNLLKGKDAKAAHARYIRDFYKRDLDELLELSSGNADEQLKEGYSHRSKKQIRKLIEFLTEIDSACNMLMQEAKVNKKPRAKKAVPLEKVVAKLKYMKSNEPLKLVSVNPVDIIGSKELWVYNTKTRKLGRYVANEYMELGVKGTTITGFSENLSVCKTVRKPEEKLKEFKAAGKVQLRKFLDEINATDTKMNGRINEETVLLKVA